LETQTRLEHCVVRGTRVGEMPGRVGNR